MNTNLTPSHDITRQALNYWRAICPLDGIPFRKDLHPWEISKILHYVNLVGVVPSDGGELRFRHLIEGSALVDRFKRSSTGKWFHENYTPEHLEKQLPSYATAVRKREPNCRLISLTSDDIEVLRYERLIAPLLDDEGGVSFLFVVFGFFPISKVDSPGERDFLPLHRPDAE